MENMKLKGTFKILDYSISHQLLLIRASHRVDDTLFNTDLLFENVFFLELAESFKDPIIQKAKEHEVEYVRKKCDYNISLQHSNVFVIKCGEFKYYIGGRKFKVSENTLLPLESSIIKT